MVRLLSILAVMCGLMGCVDQADEESTGVRVDIVVGVTSGTRADGVLFDMGSFGGTPVAGEPGTGATEGGFPPPIGDSEFRSFESPISAMTIRARMWAQTSTPSVCSLLQQVRRSGP